MIGEYPNFRTPPYIVNVSHVSWIQQGGCDGTKIEYVVCLQVLYQLMEVNSPWRYSTCKDMWKSPQQSTPKYPPNYPPQIKHGMLEIHWWMIFQTRNFHIFRGCPIFSHCSQGFPIFSGLTIGPPYRSGCHIRPQTVATCIGISRKDRQRDAT
jgi:hypothetical protein